MFETKTQHKLFEMQTHGGRCGVKIHYKLLLQKYKIHLDTQKVGLWVPTEISSVLCPQTVKL